MNHWYIKNQKKYSNLPYYLTETVFAQNYFDTRMHRQSNHCAPLRVNVLANTIWRMVVNILKSVEI